MEYQYEVGKEYKTRGGRVVEILDVNYKGRHRQRIVGKIKIHNDELLSTWQIDGTFAGKQCPHEYDLMPPVETKELWVNIYSGRAGIWWKKESADKYAVCDRIGLLKITITGDDFEVEKVSRDD